MESDDAVVLGVECVTFEYESLGGNLAKTDWVKKIEDGDIEASDLINQFSSYFFSKFRGEPLNMQILQFRAKKGRSGFVVNEYGDLMGLITLEDILEEVVGEFTTDVHDLFQEVIPQSDGEYLIDATISIKQLTRTLGWEFPSLGPRTLSGLIIEYLGYIPPIDCCLQFYNYQITVLRISGQMIKSVRVKKIEQD